MLFIFILKAHSQVRTPRALVFDVAAALVEWPVKFEVSLPARVSSCSNYLDTVCINTALSGLLVHNTS